MTLNLYYAPGACSLSPHIALREAGLPFTLTKVDTRKKLTADGADYRAINPKGYVPTLVIDSTPLTEGPAIVQYIADQNPASGLAPAAGTLARYQLQEWLNFITSELHKQFSPLFDPTTPDEVKAKLHEKIGSRFDYVVQQLGDKPYLMGAQFTVADAYLFTVANWGQFVGIDLARWPVLQAYVARVAARPKVREALAAEGLLKS